MRFFFFFRGAAFSGRSGSAFSEPYFATYLKKEIFDLTVNVLILLIKVLLVSSGI